MRAASVSGVGLHGKYHRYYFNNGYGASVIKGPNTLGGRDELWELAVLEKAADGAWDAWAPCYTTPIADAVIGWLSEDAVDTLLGMIEKLPKKEEAEWTDS